MRPPACAYSRSPPTPGIRWRAASRATLSRCDVTNGLGGMDDDRDRKAVLLRELEVPLIVAGHTHDRARAVLDQHEIRHPDRHWLPQDFYRSLQSGRSTRSGRKARRPADDPPPPRSATAATNITALASTQKPAGNDIIDVYTLIMTWDRCCCPHRFDPPSRSFPRLGSSESHLT